MNFCTSTNEGSFAPTPTRVERAGRIRAGSGDEALEAFELGEGQWLLLATLVDDTPVSLPPFDALWPEVIAGAGRGETS